ncbi:MAG TPA: hypothetical protein DCZ13_07555 [Porticoccaceae bacterium]|nr:hypothetical protein [Porticoccaceae bacterium]
MTLFEDAASKYAEKHPLALVFAGVCMGAVLAISFQQFVRKEIFAYEIAKLQRAALVPVLELEREIYIREIGRLELLEEPTKAQRADLQKYRIYLDDNREKLRKLE